MPVAPSPSAAAAPVQARIADIDMMARGSPAKKAPVRKTAAKKAAPAGRQGLFAGSVAPTERS